MSLDVRISFRTLFPLKCKFRLISVVDVVTTPMNPYQPIPFHILTFAVFQSRIVFYVGSNIEEEEEEEEEEESI